MNLAQLRKIRVAIAAGAFLLLLLGLAFKGWLGTAQVISRERLVLRP
jgi:hypothetical protein